MPLLHVLLLVAALLQQPSAGPADGLIQGHVIRSGSRTPIAGAQITLRFMTGGRTIGAISDRDGRFVFEALPGGRFSLMVQRDGFLAASPVSSDKYQTILSMSLQLAEHERRLDADFVMIPTAAISGRVTDPLGRALVNAQVQATSVDGTGRGITASTNDRGEYRLYWLPPGRYVIGVTPPRPTGPNRPRDNYAATYYPGATDTTAAVPIVAAEGSESGGIDFAMRSALTVGIAGKVMTSIPNTTILPNGMLAPRNFILELVPYDESLAAPVLVSDTPNNPDGKFTAHGVPPGRYDLLASFFDEERRRVYGYTPIAVGYTDLDGIEVHIDPPVSVNGILKIDPPGGPGLSLFRPIRLDPVDAAAGTGKRLQLVPQTVDPASGKFTIASVPPGKYTVSPVDAIYLKDVRENGQSVLKTGLRVSAADSRAPIEIQAGLAVSLSGIAIQDQRAAANISLIAVPDTGDPAFNRGTLTAANGNFTLAGLMPGQYRIFAATPDIKAASFENADFRARHQAFGLPFTFRLGPFAYPAAFAVAESSPDGVFGITQLATGSLGGTLKSPDGRVLGNNTVVLIPPAVQRQNPAFYVTATTSGNGQFSMPIVIVGDYTVVAFQDLSQSAMQNVVSLAKYAGSGVPVTTIGDGQLTEDFTAQLDALNGSERLQTLVPSLSNQSISGRVFDAAERPVSGAAVVLVAEPTDGSSPTPRAARAAANGTYNFSGGLSGRYTILAFDNVPNETLAGLITRNLSLSRPVTLNPNAAVYLLLHVIPVKP